MKKNIILLIVLAMTITITSAQKGGAGFFKTGCLYAGGSSNTLKKIAPASSLDFTNNYFMMGIEAYYRVNKFIIGWDGYSGEQGEYSFGTNSYVEPFIGATHVKLGRIIDENKQRWIYPSIGIGAAATILATYTKENGKSVNTIDQILLTPSVDMAINEDFIVTKSKISNDEKKYGGLMLGVRVGYRTSLSSTNWRNDDWARLRNMPSYSNNCFYVAVTVGAGGFVSK